jgi:hypothetical protein
MGILTRAADLAYTFRFLKLLVTKFEDTNAYKMGLIDEKGKRTNEPNNTSEKKSAYTPFHRLVFNIKRLIAVAPGGSSKLASYASALYLLKEEFGVSDKQIDKIIKESGIDVVDMLTECDNSWYLLEDRQLSPGIYKVRTNKVIIETCDEVVNQKDKIRVLDDAYPLGQIVGLDVYEALHLNTNKKIRITLGEIYK